MRAEIRGRGKGCTEQADPRWSGVYLRQSTPADEWSHCGNRGWNGHPSDSGRPPDEGTREPAAGPDRDVAETGSPERKRGERHPCAVDTLSGSD